MYGKSYDGVTGLIGVVNRPKGLAAVVAQEPVYDLYRYLYSNRVRFINSFETPGLYDGIAATPGTIGDSTDYNSNSLNDLARPGCSAQNWGDQQDPDHESAYWKPRNLIPKAKGSKIPLFMTQGFLENNTKPDGTWDFFNSVAGPKRAWFGMWDHVRGNDKDDKDRLAMGRKGWFGEVMRFYDRYLKGIKPKHTDPTLAVQSSDGRWRAESEWPPKASKPIGVPLAEGAYTDTGINNGTGDAGPPNGDGVWTISPALKRWTHMAGVPRVTVDLATEQPDANLVVDVYDIDAKLSALLITRNAYLVPGTQKVTMDLYGQDWVFPKGHRIGVLVTSSNAEWWAHQPSGQTVTVNGGLLKLPFLTCERKRYIQGSAAIRLDDYKDVSGFTLDKAAVAEATSSKFPTPPRRFRACRR
jgi:predicted acyl esterase